MRVRFAPSPTGKLHVGNARTALFNWLLARGHGGTFVLRIEDTDSERSTRESDAGIIRDIRWLGLDWDEGPDVGGPHGPYRQSERAELYAGHATRLLESGRAYYCFCSREQLDADRAAAVAEGRPVLYAGTCRAIPPDVAASRIAGGERPAIRFRVPDGTDVVFTDVVRGDVRFAHDVIGDPVILRADGTPAYNFAVVIDDALMGITHVIRGEDHISNTPRQVLLYEAFGYAPPVFAHLSLVMGPDHAPLSKRHGATSVKEFRDKGYLPEALVNYLALIGWSPGQNEELLPAEELARRFRLENVAHSAGVFDEDKLAWANRHYLKLCAPDRLVTLAEPYLRQRGFVVGPLSVEARAWLEWILPSLAASVDRLPQLADRLQTVFAEPAAPLDEADRNRDLIGAVAAELDVENRLIDKEAFRACANRVKDRTGLKGKNLFHPIRVILTGSHEGPELDLIIPAIDRAANLGEQSGMKAVVGCRERARWIARAVGA
jgi:nondiscriminating glutamyl-tRNA synthetase